MNFELFHTDDIRVEHCDNSRRGVQRVLDACREERRPYVVIKNYELGIKNYELGIKNYSSTNIEDHSKFKIQNSKLSTILFQHRHRHEDGR